MSGHTSRLRRWVCLSAWVSLSCGGTVGTSADASRADRNRNVEQGGAGRERGATIDLPVTAGVPCTYGQCGANLICMANVCYTLCPLPTSGCNDTAGGCAANETCLTASSFNGFCAPAVGKKGDRCGDNGVYCAPGTLCVRVNGQAARCYSLCKNGCGTQCGETDSKCSFCYQ